MQINPTNPFNIEINGDHFHIQKTTPQKTDSALITLIKIEHLLSNHLSYDKDHPDEFSNLSRENLYEAFKQKAKEIRNNYVEEQSQRNRIARFLFSEEGPVNDVFKRIEDLDAISFFILDKDPTSLVLEKIGIKDLSNFSRVSHQGNKIGKETIVARIKKLGYSGIDYNEAIKYLKELESELDSLKKNFNIEIPGTEFSKENYIIKKVDSFSEKAKNLSRLTLFFLCSTPQFYNKDYDRIRKFLSLNFDPKSPVGDKEKWQAEALHQAIISRDNDILKLLLKLGVDPGSTDKDQTALKIAKEFRNKDAIKILNQALKKPE